MKGRRGGEGFGRGRYDHRAQGQYEWAVRKAAMVVISFRFGWLCAIKALQTVVVSVGTQ